MGTVRRVTDAQVKELRGWLRQGASLKKAARKADMDRKSARKYREGPLPSAARSPRTWRTRPDPLAAVWPELEALLQREPSLQAVCELARMPFELGFQSFQKGERIGRAAREAGDDRPVAQAPHLASVGLHDGLIEADLPVTGHHHLPALADREDGRAVPRARRLAHRLRSVAFMPNVDQGRTSVPTERRHRASMWEEARRRSSASRIGLPADE